jgi:hypothetical protein
LLGVIARERAGKEIGAARAALVIAPSPHSASLRALREKAATRAIEPCGDILAYPILGALHHRYARI